MKSLKVASISLIMMMSLVLCHINGFAKIPEPDNIVYGLSRANTLSVRLEIGGQVIASYIMGSDPDAEGYYILRVPMDALDPRTPGTARPGDKAYIYANADPNSLVSVTIGGRGSITRLDLSDDGDCMPDDWEMQHFGTLTRDGTGDYDGDGLSDCDEYQYGTNPKLADTDGDGLPDGWETKFGLNPLANDANQDKDGDGFSNLTEYLAGTDPNDPNSKPRAADADAGPNQIVATGAIVTLNGANSTGRTSPIASYSWTQIDGASVALSSPLSAVTTFTAPSEGSDGTALTFMLTVTTGDGLQATDSCIVNVTSDNMPPVAKAGLDKTVSPYANVTLDGSESEDSDSGISTYVWAQVGGTPVTLLDPDTAEPIFAAPGDDSALVFRLTVTDSYGLKSTDTCIVNVSSGNEAPQAAAGPSQTVNGGDTVTLDGTGSTDPDGGIASYRWRQTSGSPVTLSDPTSAEPTFTASTAGADRNPLTFLLTVTDSGGLMSSATQVVTVLANDSTLHRLLWASSDGQAALWELDSSDDFVSQMLAGPFPGWTPKDYHQNSDGTGRLLWVHTSGQVCIWRLDAAGNYVGQNLFGPYPGWTPTDYDQSVGANGRLLWVHTSGQVCSWRLDAAGNYVGQNLFGPFPGWTPVRYHINTDGTSRLLWKHTSGQACLYNLDAAGNYVSNSLYGPYPGWTPTDYDQSAGGNGRLLWVHTSGQAALWQLDSSDNYVNVVLHGPYSGWTPRQFHQNLDGTGRLLWEHTSGQAALWQLDSSDNWASQTLHGPYPDWSAIQYE